MRGNKKSAQEVLTRLMDFCEYLNQFDSGYITLSDTELMEDLNEYSNRKTLGRDLKRLQELNYIQIDTAVYTPVSIKGGTAKQFIRKQRVIRFKPSDTGLLALDVKTKPGDTIGHIVVDGETYEVVKEDLIKQVNGALFPSNSEWIVGPDHTLIKNPNYSK